MQVAHQVFQGLMQVGAERRRRAWPPSRTSPRTWETTDAQTWIFHLKTGRDVPGARRAGEVTAQDFVDSWNRVTDPTDQSYVAYILAPIEGCDDRGYQTDPARASPASRRSTTTRSRSRFATRSPTSRPTLRPPGRGGRRRSSTSTRSARRRTRRSPWAPAPTWSSRGSHGRVHRARQEPGLLGRRAAPATWTRSTCRSIDDVETMWLEFQEGELDCSQVPSGPGRGRRRPAPRSRAATWTAARVAGGGRLLRRHEHERPDAGHRASSCARRSSQSADAQAVVDDGQRGRGRGRPAATCPPGIPGYKAAQNPYPYDLERRHGRRHRPGRRPDAQLLVRHATRTTGGSPRCSSGRLGAGRPRRRAQRLRVGRRSSTSCRAATRAAAASSSASPGSPTTRRWTTSSTRSSSRTSRAPAATRSTPTQGSTTAPEGARHHGRPAAPQPVRPGREAHPHRHAGRAAVLLPVLPRRPTAASRGFTVDPMGAHRHAGRLGRVDGCDCVDCIVE